MNCLLLSLVLMGCYASGNIKWVLSDGASSQDCNKACQSIGRVCRQEDLSKSAQSESWVKEGAVQAGTAGCSSVQERCDMSESPIFYSNGRKCTMCTNVGHPVRPSCAGSRMLGVGNGGAGSGRLCPCYAASETKCVGDAALNLDRCAGNYEVVPEFPCYDRTIPATRISGGGWKTPEQCSAMCDDNADCGMYAILIRDHGFGNVGHCIFFSYADVASGLKVQEGGNPHLKCAKKQSVQCPRSNFNGANANLDCASKEFEGTCTARCNSGWTGTARRYKCQANGIFSQESQPISCSRIQCSRATFSVTNAELDCDSQLYEGTCTARCMAGYKSNHDHTYRCESDGSFAAVSQEISCRLITAGPTPSPTKNPSPSPTTVPTPSPTTLPTPSPTTIPTTAPSPSPTTVPTSSPTTGPTRSPATTGPSTSPTTTSPTSSPSPSPSTVPTPSPTTSPTPSPTTEPTTSPSTNPTPSPTTEPTTSPSAAPTPSPTEAPTAAPSVSPTTLSRSAAPSARPTFTPTTIALIIETRAAEESVRILGLHIRASYVPWLIVLLIALAALGLCGYLLQRRSATKKGNVKMVAGDEVSRTKGEIQEKADVETPGLSTKK